MAPKITKTSLILGFGLLLSTGVNVAQDNVVQETVRLEIELLSSSGHLHFRGIEVASGNLLVEIYENRRFRPAWTDLDQVDELLTAIETTAADGLDPADYHLEQVRTGYRQLLAGDVTTAIARAELDVLFTDSLIRLVYHQRFGKLNPYTLDPQWNFRRDLDGVSAAAAIQSMIDADSLLYRLQSLFPRGRFYEQLRQSLARYREIEANGGWPEFPEGPTLKPGMVDNRVPVLARRLAVTGDLDTDAVAAADTTYTEIIEAGVRRFQKRHGIDVDGVIGPTTARVLNVPVSRRVRQLEINLERARWVFDDITDNFIIVNIAGFTAYVVRDREVVWQTRVQVGSTYHQSPVFRDEMKYLVLNPTWTVPYSIATKEILPQIQSEPDYFAKRDFDVKDRNGKLVDPESIEWSELSRRNFPYTLVQRPGPNNALGRVKFMFPNEHAVYLHDTPSKSLFGRAERAFSHGCIRVEHPFEFAEILLGADGWTQDRFQEVLDSGEIKTVFLSKPMPVMLLYWTAQVDPGGDVHFYQDIYERDQRIEDGLDSEFVMDLPESGD
ncbi:L,D-transpeptidase family protein [Gammaproteobacteria bacterium]|jgi:murein L,D-transpeptidase YcbB/YkuD|nr:L,D-transpeptidase family protein [Gammaproteobacteria bacterium]